MSDVREGFADERSVGAAGGEEEGVMLHIVVEDLSIGWIHRVEGIESVPSECCTARNEAFSTNSRMLTQSRTARSHTGFLNQVWVRDTRPAPMSEIATIKVEGVLMSLAHMG